MRRIIRIALITAAVVVAILALHTGLAAWSKSAGLAPNAASRACAVCHK